jgi:FkbH-like protein
VHSTPELQPPRNPILAIAATFTAEPLLPALRFVLDAAGLALDVHFAPYHQVLQELISSTSLLANNSSGVNAVLVRIEDFVREVRNVDEARNVIGHAMRELLDALMHFTRRAKVPTVLSVLQPSPAARGELIPDLEAASVNLLAQASLLPGIILLSPTEIELVTGGEHYDTAADELAHVPFTDGHYASIGLAIARKVHALRVPPHKVLVLDCDNTLWRGAVGEDGVEGIMIPPALARVQQFAVEVQARGTLVCLASKNTERDVLEVFEKRSDMVLKREHIVAHRINWDPKPRNLASLARALNLGLDAFVYLDDNPVECALMRAELPQVTTLQLPSDPEINSFLSNLWTFDVISVTNEDTRRTSMYRENVARRELDESITDIAEFITSLKVVTDVAPPEESEWSRIAQLTQRTNQFNFTTIRRTEPEIRALPRRGSNVLRIRVRDRFGDYGLVGLVITDRRANALAVDTLLLSCRVLGRGVEHTILRRLGELAKEYSLSYVHLSYLTTPQNEPARAFAEGIAAQFRSEERERIVYCIPTNYACAITHRPGHHPTAVIEALKSEEESNSASSSSSGFSTTINHVSGRYEDLARTLASGKDVLRAARMRDARRRLLPGKPTNPMTDTERKLLALWQELLGVDGLGVEDDFFALGGTSLLAARLFAGIARQFGAKLSLASIVEAPTVRALSRLLESQRMERSNNLVELKRGGPRSLFLVHDGHGATLLYLNLARRMPNSLAVFGIEPRRIPGMPIAHARIEDMAAFYIQEVRKIQPHGPYLLGGLCGGGLIAYEMAVQLECMGERIELLAVLDAATPQAPRRREVTRRRLQRLTQALADARAEEHSPAGNAFSIVSTVLWEATNAVLREITRRGRQLSVRVRFRLLRELLARQRPWAWPIPELTAYEIVVSAEANYVPKPLSDATDIVLVRARGAASETPYCEKLADETMGWGALAQGLIVLDVDGGHSSMLQEPFVESLVATLMPPLGYSSKPTSSRAIA